MFGFTAGALFVSKKIGQYQEIEYYKPFFVTGLLGFLAVLSLHSLSNLNALIYFTGVMTVSTHCFLPCIEAAKTRTHFI